MIHHRHHQTTFNTVCIDGHASGNDIAFYNIPYKGSCTYYVITFGGPKRPPPLCNIVIIWAYPPPM